MKRILIAILLAGITVNLFAQYAPADSLLRRERLEIRGEKYCKAGRAVMVTGASLAFVGGAVFLTPLVIDQLKYQMHIPTYGYGCIVPWYLALSPQVVALGGLICLGGLPFYVGGLDMKQGYPASRTTRRYDGDGQAGWGFIMEAGIPQLMNIETGYHFNKNLFLGAGVGLNPSFPVYADIRHSWMNRSCTPYAGLKYGMTLGGEAMMQTVYVNGDLVENYSVKPYVALDFGLRFRLSTEEPSSVIVALTADTSWYGGFGLKIGWIL